jgi:putative flippase GtrA
MTAQVDKVRTMVGAGVPLAINAHQHVHMIPLVFEALTILHKTVPFSSIRVCRESMFVPEISLREYSITGGLRFFGLNILSLVLASHIRKQQLPVHDSVVGILTSGALTHTSVQRSLAETVRLERARVEIVTHPGKAESHEVHSWNGDREWHVSPSRERERDMLQSASFKTLAASFVDGSFAYAPSHVLQVGRYVCAGGTVALISVLMVYFFTDIVGLWYIGSAVCASVVSVMVSFVLQKFWTFSKRGHKDTARELMLFFGNTFLNFLTNIILLYVLVEYAHVWYVGAQIIALAVIAVLNFFMYRYIIFPKRTPVTI